MEAILERLLASDEPSIRYKIRAGVLSEDVASPTMRALQEEISTSSRVTALLAEREAASRAAEVFLSRRLFRRLRDGSVIRSGFLQLCYPPYWHYSILNGLKVMAEAGFMRDERCEDALDVLESKRLPDGGFPAEIAYYATAPSCTSGHSLVKWGIRRAGQMNEWVTAEALCVLAAAGRI